MRRTTLPVLLTTVLLPLAATPPVFAANEMSTSMAGGVLYESCVDHSYSYSVTLPAGYTDRWEMDMSLIGPDGFVVDTDFLYTPEGTAGVSEFSICALPNLEGTYVVRGTGRACTSTFVCVPIDATSTTLSYRFPDTRTTLRARPTRPARGQVVRFRVRSKDERPTGFFGTVGATVRLQAYRGGRWRTLRRDTTDDRGRLTFRVRFTGRPLKVRALTPSTSSINGSTSRTVRVR